MFFGVFNEVPEPALQGEICSVNRHLVLLIDLFGCRQLEEVVVAAEVLVVKPDVAECNLHLLFV